MLGLKVNHVRKRGPIVAHVFPWHVSGVFVLFHTSIFSPPTYKERLIKPAWKHGHEKYTLIKISCMKKKCICVLTLWWTIREMLLLHAASFHTLIIYYIIADPLTISESYHRLTSADIGRIILPPQFIFATERSPTFVKPEPIIKFVPKILRQKGRLIALGYFQPIYYTKRQQFQHAQNIQQITVDKIYDAAIGKYLPLWLS